MPTIGIIDDREEARAVVMDALILGLPDEWEVVSSAPLFNLSEYPSWIAAHKISLIIIDERLNEATLSDETAVNYFGHDLVEYLRSRMKNIPIFVITSHPGDEELRNRFADVEDIIDRLAFTRESESYATRFARASQRYLEVFENELAELSNIAIKIASGYQVTDTEQNRARAIQEKINIAFSLEELENRTQWIEQMQNAITELEQVREEIDIIIKKGGQQ